MVPLQFGHIYPSYKCPLDPATSCLAIYLADILVHEHKNLYSKYVAAALFKYKRLKRVEILISGEPIK